VTEYRFRATIQALLARRPFRPFRVRLKCGAQFHITHPENLNIRDGAVTYSVPGEPPTNYVFDHESVSTLFDADARPEE
jgi:hypothetical protein